MKAIIDERPNAVPVSVGNNSSGYGTSILVPSGNVSELDCSESGPRFDTTDGDGDNNNEGGGSGGGCISDADGEGSEDEQGDSDIEDVPTEDQLQVLSKTPAVTKRKAAADAPGIKMLKTSA